MRIMSILEMESFHNITLPHIKNMASEWYDYVTSEEYISMLQLTLQNELSNVTTRDYVYISLIVLLLLYIFFSTKKYNHSEQSLKRYIDSSRKIITDHMSDIESRLTDVYLQSLNQKQDINVNLTVKNQNNDCEIQAERTCSDSESDSEIIVTDEDDGWECYRTQEIKNAKMTIWCPLQKKTGGSCNKGVHCAIYKDGVFKTFSCDGHAHIYMCKTKNEYERFKKSVRDLPDREFKDVIQTNLNKLRKQQKNHPMNNKHSIKYRHSMYESGNTKKNKTIISTTSTFN